MGFSTYRFVSPVDPNLLCGVCGGVLEDAVVTPCGHSFCCLCLHTWLARPAALTCPECRAKVVPDSVKPVHSLRNLVRALVVECDHADRGCKDSLKLDLLSAHLATCIYAPVECAGCAESVSRLNLAHHQMTCAGIAASVREEDEERYGEVERERRRREEDNDDDEYYLDRDFNEEDGDGGGGEETDRFDASWSEVRERLQQSKHGAGPGDICLLLARIRALEGRVEKLLDELRAARVHNRQLERQYERIGDQLRHKQGELRQLQDAQFFLDHEAGRSPDTVARLSLLIARNLLHKPRYLLGDDVFKAVRRCYDNFHVRDNSTRDNSTRDNSTNRYASDTDSTHRSSLYRPSSAGVGRGVSSSTVPSSQAGQATTCEHDVHMLLATAYASTWFNTSQRLSIKSWLSAITSKTLSSSTLPSSSLPSSSSSSFTTANSSIGFSAFRPGSSLFNNR